MYSQLLQLWKKLPLPKFAQIGIMRLVNDQFLIGVTGIIFNDKQEILLVKHTYRDVAWSLPGGYLKAGEHPKNGLAREIYEETKLVVQIEKIIKTNHDETDARLNMTYIGTLTEGTFEKSDEVIDFGFFTIETLPKLIDDQYEQITLAYKRHHQLHKKSFLDRVQTRLKKWIPTFKGEKA